MYQMPRRHIQLNGKFLIGRVLYPENKLESKSLIQSCLVKMPRLTVEQRKKVVRLHQEGLNSGEIQKRLIEDDLVSVTRMSIWRLVQKYQETGQVIDRVRPQHNTKVTEEMRGIIDETYYEDRETSAALLKLKIAERTGRPHYKI